MSDSWLVVIPEDPGYLPDAESVRRASGLLASLVPLASEVTSDQSFGIKLRDCGGNLESISCPHCHAEIETEAWQEMIEADWDGSGFLLKAQRMACCGREVTMNDLVYEFPQGFSRFALAAMNPNRVSLSEDEKERLAEALGCGIRVVWRHL